MPLDFALYIVAAIVVTGAVCIFAVAGIGWVARKVRARRTAKARAAAYAAMGKVNGFYIAEDDALTDSDIDHILPGELRGYDDRDGAA